MCWCILLAAAVYATAVSENIFVPLLETVITLGITVTSLVRIIKVLKNDKETVEA